MKRIVVIFFSSTLAFGCLASERHVITGAASDFCLPALNKIADVPWVPSDKPGAPPAFAFAGCASMPSAKAPQCGTPPEIISGVIQPKSTFHSQRWSDFGAESLLKRVAQEPGAELKPYAGGSVVVVHNPKIWKRDWYVWMKVSPLTGTSPTQLKGEDVLAATCHRAPSSAPGVIDGDKPWVCDRSTVSDDYALKYSFRSASNVPENLEGLDSAMKTAISRWRCNTKR